MPQSVTSILSRELAGNTVGEWVLAAATLVLTPLVLLAVRRVAARRLHRIAHTTATRIDDVIVELLERTRTWFFVALGVVLASLLIELPHDGTRYLRLGAVSVALVQGGLWGVLAVERIIEQHFSADDPNDIGRATGSAVIRLFGIVAVWSLVLLMALANLGVDITALVAGLGIGGIALALGLQNILGDLFASVSILLDKPFVVGDFIIVGEFMGTVERIGVKTSHLRSLGGELIVFSNSDLLQSRVRNYRNMERRRVLFRLGVVYQTPHEQLRRIPQMLEECVQGIEGVSFDRAHFAEFGDFALKFEVVYFVLDRDYNVHMDHLQELNLAIHGAFQREGIEFAYPTQTLFTSKLAEPS